MSRVILIIAVGLLLGCCGSGGGDTDGRPGAAAVVVTTSVLGDVVQQISGDLLAVEVVMPRGADPHDFQASAQQVDAIGRADAVIVNGGGFEEALLDVVEAGERDGVATFDVLADGLDGVGGPHFFTDPVLVADAIPALTAFLAETTTVDPDALDAQAAAYERSLRSLDDEIETILASVPGDERVLVTTHDVFRAFADRYGFTVLGTVVPTGTTVDGVSAASLAALAEAVEQAGVPALFADSSSSDDLVRAVADEAGDVAVVELFTESLGTTDTPAQTYVQMMRTNAERIAAALGR